MSKLEALRELLEKVESDLDTAHHHAKAFPSESAGGHCTWHDSHKASSGSMDASLSLFDAVLPGWECGFDSAGMTWVKQPGLRSSFRTHTKSNPSRALLIAILEALISLEESK